MARGGLGAVEKALHLLDFFGPGERSYTLTDLSHGSGVSKASCYRTLQILQRYGLVEREGDVYRLGYRLLELAAHVKASIEPLSVGLDLMEKLRDEVDQSVQLVVRSGDEVIYAEVLPPFTPSRLFVRPGGRAPLYAGASGKLHLATLADDDLTSCLERLEPLHYTRRTPSAVEQIMDDVRLTRSTWCSRSLGELERYSAELAVPIMGAGKKTLAVLSLAGSEKDYVEHRSLQTLLLALDATALGISRRLGFDGSWPTRPEAFLSHCETRAKSADKKARVDPQ